MGVIINHAISFLTSPLSVALALLVAGLALAAMRRRRAGLVLTGLGLALLYCMSSGWMYTLLGCGLERDYPPVRAEDLPRADAIVVLGGGVEAKPNVTFYTELYASADRVAHAARLWKAGRAPVIIPSGSNELNASRPLLLEFGVPESAISVENASRNTEENARFVAEYVRRRHGWKDGADRREAPKVLLVTSAWHMRRSLLMFRKYAPGLAVVPAACDHEALLASEPFKIFGALLPSAENLSRNSYMIKEIVGYWGYRLLR